MVANRQDRGCDRQHRECSRVDRISGRTNDRGKRTESESNTSVVPVSYSCRTTIVLAVLDRQRSGVKAPIWWFCHDRDRSGRSPIIGNIGKEWSAQWLHYERHGVSNHWRLDNLLNCLFRLRSKKMSKFRVTGLCEGNPPLIGGFPSQRASNAEMFPLMTSSWM